MLGLFVCFTFQGLGAIVNCRIEKNSVCTECNPGYYVTGSGQCINLGCSYTRYCIGCTNGDLTSSCTACSSAYSQVTLTSSDGKISIKNCLKNNFQSVCVLLGVEGCTNGCQLDLDMSLETGLHVWVCLEAEEEAEATPKIVHFNDVSVAAIVIGMTTLLCAAVGVVLFFLVCA